MEQSCASQSTVQLYPQGSATILPLILSLATTICLFLCLSHERNFFCVDAQLDDIYYQNNDLRFFNYQNPKICSSIHFGTASYQQTFVDSTGVAVQGDIPGKLASNLRVCLVLTVLSTIFVFCITGVLASGACFVVPLPWIGVAQTLALLLLGTGFACIVLTGAENDYYDHDDDGFSLDNGGLFLIMALVLLFASLVVSVATTRATKENKDDAVDTDEEQAVAPPPASNGWSRVGK